MNISIQIQLFKHGNCEIMMRRKPQTLRIDTFDTFTYHIFAYCHLKYSVIGSLGFHLKLSSVFVIWFTWSWFHGNKLCSTWNCLWHISFINWNLNESRVYAWDFDKQIQYTFFGFSLKSIKTTFKKCQILSTFE